MNLVWFSWKDIWHPTAGGAETVSWQIMKRLAKDGHQVKLITSRYNNSMRYELVDGVYIHRTGGRISVYIRAFFLFKRREYGSWADLVIDEMNTIPFLCAFYSKTKSLLLVYQLARKVWFYQMPFPLSLLGYITEPLYLQALSHSYPIILTESASTLSDLSRHGFDKSKIGVFRVGINIKPVEQLVDQKDMNLIIVLGAVRPMKRTLSAVKAFELARDKNPALQMILAGDTNSHYASRVINYINSSIHREAITVLGKISNKQRLDLIRKSTILVATSIKEGWGLVVTEANSQGTPAVAYDVDGLRDSIRNNKTGFLVKSGDEEALSAAINKLVRDIPTYNIFRQNAWEDSKQYNFDNSYKDFIKCARIK